MDVMKYQIIYLVNINCNNLKIMMTEHLNFDIRARRLEQLSQMKNMKQEAQNIDDLMIKSSQYPGVVE